jgi:hypothetical protein
MNIMQKLLQEKLKSIRGKRGRMLVRSRSGFQVRQRKMVVKIVRTAMTLILLQRLIIEKSAIIYKKAHVSLTDTSDHESDDDH